MATLLLAGEIGRIRGGRLTIAVRMRRSVQTVAQVVRRSAGEQVAVVEVHRLIALSTEAVLFGRLTEAAGRVMHGRVGALQVAGRQIARVVVLGPELVRVVEDHRGRLTSVRGDLWAAAGRIVRIGVLVLCEQLIERTDRPRRG